MLIFLEPIFWHIKENINKQLLLLSRLVEQMRQYNFLLNSKSLTKHKDSLKSEVHRTKTQKRHYQTFI